MQAIDPRDEGGYFTHGLKKWEGVRRCHTIFADRMAGGATRMTEYLDDEGITDYLRGLANMVSLDLMEMGSQIANLFECPFWVNVWNPTEGDEWTDLMRD